MNTDVRILMEFLGQTAAEVSGRENPEPHGEMASLLERFAQGQCSQEERAKVCQILRDNPAWLRWLADHVRVTRDTEHPS
jgi:hypothetical protein